MPVTPAGLLGALLGSLDIRYTFFTSVDERRGRPELAREKHYTHGLASEKWRNLRL